MRQDDSFTEEIAEMQQCALHRPGIEPAWQAVIPNSTLEVLVFTPKHAPEGGWSLAPIRTEEGRQGAEMLLAALNDIAHTYNISAMYAPKVDAFSGAICLPRDLSEEISLPSGKKIFQNRNLPADGVVLPPKGALIMSTSGCPLALFYGNGREIAAHAGRKSLLGTDHNGDVRHGGLIARAVDTLNASACYGKDVHFWIGFSIPEYAFSHPLTGTDAPRWEAMRNDIRKKFPDVSILRESDGALYLDLLKYAKAEAERNHILPSRITFGPDIRSIGGADTRNGNERNLIVVRRL
jgi:hypothetical protein